MKKYRYYMLNNVIWCYLYHFGVFVTRPVLLFPSFCVIVEPIIPIHEELVGPGFYALMVAIINMDFSVVLSLFYRYSQVSILNDV